MPNGVTASATCKGSIRRFFKGPVHREDANEVARFSFEGLWVLAIIFNEPKVPRMKTKRRF